MENPILALVPSGYKNGKVYSVLPVDGDGDFQFFRFGDGTRIKENGLIETIVGSNNPRLNWGGECPSLLMEGTSTNLQIRSEQFDNVAWTKTNVTITANDTISPDGTESADKLQRISTSASYLSDILTIGFGVKTYTNSIFVKKGVGDFFAIRVQASYPARVDLRFQFSTKQIVSYAAQSGFTALNSSVEEFDNDWFRIYFTYSTNGNNIITNYFSPRFTLGYIDSTDTNTTANCFLWGAQIEEQIYGSSYIKTEGSQITRALERRISTTLSGETQFNKNKGVVFLDVKPFAVDSSNTLGNVINLRGGTYNIIQFAFKTSNVLQFFINEFPSSPIVNYNFTHNGGRFKVAVKWDSGSYKLFANGQLLNSYLDTNRLFSSLSIFQFQGDDDYLNFEGEIYNSQVFGNALTDAEIITLTAL